MEIKYIEGDSLAFVMYVKSFGNNAELTNIDGHARWVIHGDGEDYIVRPIEAKPV